MPPQRVLYFTPATADARVALVTGGDVYAFSAGTDAPAPQPRILDAGVV